MQVLKKYAQLIDFIKVFNKYNDANTLVNISDDEYEILMNFASYLNDPSYVPDYPQGEPGAQGPTGDKGPTGDAGQVEGNVITSNINGLQIDVVNNMPNEPDENTLYVVV